MTIDVTTQGAANSHGVYPHRRAGEELAKLLLVYNSYRLTVSLILLGLAVAHHIGLLDMRGFQSEIGWVAGCWLLSTLAVGALAPPLANHPDGATAVILFDLVVITFFVQYGSELNAGLKLLYLVTTAAGAVLIPSSMTVTGVAAIATIAVLFDSAYLVQRGTIATNELLSAALLGTMIFLISLVIQKIVQRLSVMEKIAEVASTQIASLEELNQQIITHMTTGVCRISDSGRLTPINSAALQLLGLTTLGKEVPLGELHTTLSNYIESKQAGHSIDAAPFKPDPDGKPVIAEMVAVGKDFNPEFLLFVEDFTPINEAAQNLKLNSLGKLTASIAHEIRNPLAAISHASQLMRESVTEKTEQEALWKIIISNTQRVNAIIENVLQLSRRLPTDLQSIDLEAWLRLFIPEYEYGCEPEINVEYVVEGSVDKVSFDPSNLRRVLTNLLDNALRHAAENTDECRVLLKLSTNSTRRFAYIDVLDSGAGVDEQNVSRLFEPFFTTAQAGSGLGLYICRELCASNGANLTYDKTLGGWTRFRVTIPIKESDQ